ncbi:MAG: hypothetical protein JST68_29030 [Bacteroidetes bacterium]|nr:hypothetical protein [Bacteroidota bacterium]
MAEDLADDISWLMSIAQQHLDYLGPIRHWAQLKIAAEPGTIWIRGLTPELLDSAAIKSIPFKQVFYSREGLLFPYGGSVPVRKLPSSLLWTPLERGLPLHLPSFNHNYFGVGERVAPRLISSENQALPAAMLTPLALLGNYIETAPAIRLKGLTWIILDDQALILGKPLLPLPGESYWEKDDFLLPAGMDWEWPVLAKTLSRELNPEGDCRLLWHRDSRYTLIPNEQIRPLSISSFRLSKTS